MKSKLFFSLLLSFCFYLLSSQVPQGFNYQAIARDGITGNPITSALPVRISIQSDLAGTTIFWVEDHSSVTPNSSGLFTLVVGGGVRQSGLASFSDIDWFVTPKYIKTQVFYQSEWKDMGVSQIWAVPYSMSAQSAGELAGSLDKLTVEGKSTSLTDPLFEVKNSNGQTIFAVYNEGVRIYVSDGDLNKGAKGGFAIGGFDMSKGGGEYLRVTKDSTRIYINDLPTKTAKGGFAIGGFGMDKGGSEYLRVTPDSTRVYINDLPTKTAKGGFAIGGFSMDKGNSEFLRVTPDSTRVYIKEQTSKTAKGGFAIGGFDVGKAGTPKPNYLSVLSTRTKIQISDTLQGFSVTNIQGGGASDLMRIDKINAFIGNETGLKTTPSTTGDQGKYNVFLGYMSGNKNTLGYRNVFMGYRSGMANLTAEDNVFIGTESGLLNESGNSNTFIGFRSGYLTTTSENTFVGHGSGYFNETGKYNTFLGKGSGSFHTLGDYNTYLGWGAGNNNSASRNVFVGAGAGNTNIGSGNVFIGYNADVSGSNKLIITNYYGGPATPAPPLIIGDFAGQRIAINRTSTNNSYTFFVEGTAAGLSAWTNTSDERLKTKISTITGALEKVLLLRGVNFEWKDTSNIEKGQRMGFVAQEVEPVVPEVVSKSDGTYMMQYGPVTALLVQAMKEQQGIINDQKIQINLINQQCVDLKSQIDDISNQLKELKSGINK